MLMNRGFWDPVNVKLFPVAAKAIHDCCCPAVEVFFASMSPNTDIKLHSDFANFVLTSHLALDIPNSGENLCRLTIGDTERQWINGEIMLFDTSILHSAVNESEKTRFILMMRVWHPDLTETERNALQYIYNCLEFPELASGDVSERICADAIVEAARRFPEIKKGTGRKSGFLDRSVSRRMHRKKRK